MAAHGLIINYFCRRSIQVPNSISLSFFVSLIDINWISSPTCALTDNIWLSTSCPCRYRIAHFLCFFPILFSNFWSIFMYLNWFIWMTQFFLLPLSFQCSWVWTWFCDVWPTIIFPMTCEQLSPGLLFTCTWTGNIRSLPLVVLMHCY